MREFKDSEGETVDLDDPKTYSHLPDDWNLLDDFMFKEIGYALCYMNIFHPDVFKGKRDGGQKKRVMKLINNFCENRRIYYEDKMWYKEQIYIFHDETENMC
jgi:hypothetical protein